MKRACVLLLALVLCAGLALPVLAVPQNAMIQGATAAAQSAVGKDTPGAAVAVFEGGVRTLFEGYGYADITARTLVTAQTSFEIGELSSLFVLLAAQKLVEQGKAELDRDIAYYLPADFMAELSLSYEITLRDLLTGGAGFAARGSDLRYASASLCFDDLRDALLADVPAQINPPALYHTPSAFELGLAAFAVECIVERSYADFVSETILVPLGMKHTFLDPRENSAIIAPATGHTATGEGVFAAAEKSGRTWGAIWPADGAISHLADLSTLLEFLLNDTVGTDVLTPASRAAVCDMAAQNGIFCVGAAGLAVSGTARSLRADTAHFSAAVCFDRAARKGAVVLCNTAESALLSLPDALCGFSHGIPVSAGGTLYDAEIFEGEYLPVFAQRGTLLGRGERNLHVALDEDGTLLFGEQRLVQIAPGIFADAEDPTLALVQFTLTIEGEIAEIYTADGICYRAAGFFEWDAVQSVLFWLLVLGAVYFLVAGVLALADALLSRARGDRYPRAWRFTLPWLLAALHALFTLLQILVATAFGSSALATFFTATSVLALLCTIGAAVGFAFALLTAFMERGMLARVARSGIIYVAFLLLGTYFGVILL